MTMRKTRPVSFFAGLTFQTLLLLQAISTNYERVKFVCFVAHTYLYKTATHTHYTKTVWTPVVVVITQTCTRTRTHNNNDKNNNNKNNNDKNNNNNNKGCFLSLYSYIKVHLGHLGVKVTVITVFKLLKAVWMDGIWHPRNLHGLITFFNSNAYARKPNMRRIETVS